MIPTLVIGLPCSGKSSFVKHICTIDKTKTYFEIDDYISKVGKEYYNTHTEKCNTSIYNIIREAMPDYIVAVGYERNQRVSIRQLFHFCNLLYIDCDYDLCLKRNKIRNRKISLFEMNLISSNFDQILKEEGFTKVSIVKVNAMSEFIYGKIINGEAVFYADIYSCEEDEKIYKTGKLYDWICTLEDWEAAGSAARLVTGEIVLGEDEAVKRQRQEQIIRDERYLRLRKCDKVSPMRWLDMSVEEQQAWVDYRHALLDIPQQEGFPWNGDITQAPWPTVPSEEGE